MVRRLALGDRYRQFAGKILAGQRVLGRLDLRRRAVGSDLAALVARAAPAWRAAQAAYEGQVGVDAAAALRLSLADVVAALHTPG